MIQQTNCPMYDTEGLGYCKVNDVCCVDVPPDRCKEYIEAFKLGFNAGNYGYVPMGNEGDGEQDG